MDIIITYYWQIFIAIEVLALISIFLFGIAFISEFLYSRTYTLFPGK